jgi:hypothetical protein
MAAAATVAASGKRHYWVKKGNSGYEEMTGYCGVEYVVMKITRNESISPGTAEPFVR